MLHLSLQYSVHTNIYLEEEVVVQLAEERILSFRVVATVDGGQDHGSINWPEHSVELSG